MCTWLPNRGGSRGARLPTYASCRPLRPTYIFKNPKRFCNSTEVGTYSIQLLYFFVNKEDLINSPSLFLLIQCQHTENRTQSSSPHYSPHLTVYPLVFCTEPHLYLFQFCLLLSLPCVYLLYLSVAIYFLSILKTHPNSSPRCHPTTLFQTPMLPILRLRSTKNKLGSQMQLWRL